MESTKHHRSAFVKRNSSHRAARMLMIALAACASIAIAPHLRSATAAVTPTFTETNLVSDVPGMAKTTDPNLVNPWGMALGLNSGIWVSDNGTGKATTYDGTGKPIATASAQIVTIPSPKNSAAASSPTGVTTNDT